MLVPLLEDRLAADDAIGDPDPGVNQLPSFTAPIGADPAADMRASCRATVRPDHKACFFHHGAIADGCPHGGYVVLQLAEDQIRYIASILRRPRLPSLMWDLDDTLFRRRYHGTRAATTTAPPEVLIPRSVQH